MTDSPSEVRFGYWDIRGLAQPTRMLAAYLKAPLKDELYAVGEAPEYNRDSWLSVKPTLDLDFPNLPYLIDGDLKITQSSAILRYIARKFGAGTGVYEGDAAHLAQIDMIIDEVVDLRSAATRVSYGGAPYDSFHSTTAPKHLKALEALFAKDDRAYAAGKTVTLADFVLHEVLELVSDMVSDLSKEDVLAATPRLKAYKELFESIPAIKEYRASAAFIKRPYNNKMAVWK